MIAFVDNDVITKLAACDLLDAAHAALAIPRDCVVLLPTAPFSLFVRKNREKGIARYGVDGHRRICEFFDGASLATDAPATEDLKILSAVDGIDPGEANLIALCARNPDGILLTGDKRAIRALGAAPGLDELRSALQGRVHCLECLVRLSIEHLGFSTALPRIVAGCGCDKVLGSVFGSGNKTTESSALEGLQHYEDHLRKEAAGLLRGA